MEAVPQEARGRARFEALRRSIFAEMARSSARMRLLWVVPFQVGVLALLLVRGFSTTAATVFAVTLLATTSLFLYQARTRVYTSSLLSLLFGFTTYLVNIGVTGGLASPLVPTGISILFAAAVLLSDAKAKRTFFSVAILAFVGMAFASGTRAGELVAPLTPDGTHPSREFILLSVGSLVLTAISMSRLGTTVSDAYARVAFELAARREELCSEGEDRTRALEGVAARLAHEVKNPLAAIKGLSTHMARSAADPKTAERLSIVAAEADRLQSIVDGFLSFSRGLDELHATPTRPHDLARELTLLLETRAADAGVTLDVTGDAAVTLTADARKLRQALLNLVLNAMQASPKGGRVTIDVGHTCPFKKETLVKVIDRGAGMTREVLERIQKPYFTTREGGTGLGVAVARGLVEQHGGSLEYESTPGRGTTVTLRLPTNALDASTQERLPKVACGPSACARAALGLPNAAGAEEEKIEAPAEAPVVAKV